MFDENDAIEFIRKKLGDEISGMYSDDDILNIIDAIWDCYEENGLQPEHIDKIVNAELEYELSILD